MNLVFLRKLWDENLNSSVNCFFDKYNINHPTDRLVLLIVLLNMQGTSLIVLLKKTNFTKIALKQTKFTTIVLKITKFTKIPLKQNKIYNNSIKVNKIYENSIKAN